MSLEQVGKLTRRDVEEIYFHPRNDKGEIEIPGVGHHPGMAALASDGPPTLESELLGLMTAASALGLSPENVEAVRKRLVEKFGGTGDGSGRQTGP